MLNLAGYFLRDTQNVTGKDWNRLIKELMALRNYQLLNFVLSQAGTAAPTFDSWIVNDLEKQGDLITTGYNDVGAFSIISELGSFKENKTFLTFSAIDYSAAGQSGVDIGSLWFSVNELNIFSVDSFNGNANDMIRKVEFKIFIID